MKLKKFFENTDEKKLRKKIESSDEYLPLISGKDVWEYKQSPNDDLLIVNPEYSNLCDFFDKLSMMDRPWPVKYCRNMKDEEHEDYVEWREWDLEVLKEDKSTVTLLKENNFNPPEHLL
jgi:hypothetical protein